MSEVIIRVDRLRKVYGDLVAVDDVSFEVRRGEIFGMVGPNGAGKTTTIECVQGQRRPDGGSVRVLGIDPHAAGPALRERIGVQLQQTMLPPRIKVWEAVDLFSSFYRDGKPWREVLELLGLMDKRDAYFHKLSGGQRQRLYVALALVNEPDILFLDELTTGLDPQARRRLWELLADLRARGRTIFLTTHFMEEAERLSDRVAVVDHGRIVALDTPRNLIRGTAVESRLSFEVEGDFNAAGLADVETVNRVERAGGRVVVYGREGLLGSVVQAAERQGCRLRDVRAEPPNLEDVFLALTGKELRG